MQDSLENQHRLMEARAMNEMIRCYDCKWFKGKYSGWCCNPAFEKKIRVQAVDFCEKAEKKEGGGDG